MISGLFGSSWLALGKGLNRRSRPRSDGVSGTFHSTSPGWRVRPPRVNPLGHPRRAGTSASGHPVLGHPVLGHPVLGQSVLGESVPCWSRTVGGARDAVGMSRSPASEFRRHPAAGCLTKRDERALLEESSNNSSMNRNSASCGYGAPDRRGGFDPRSPSEGARRSRVRRPGQRERVSLSARHPDRAGRRQAGRARQLGLGDVPRQPRGARATWRSWL